MPPTGRESERRVVWWWVVLVALLAMAALVVFADLAKAVFNWEDVNHE